VSHRVNRTAAIGADPVAGRASITDQRRAPTTMDGGLPTRDRVCPPPPEFVANANPTANADGRAAPGSAGFRADRARRPSRASPFAQVLGLSDAPPWRWFADGQLKVALQSPLPGVTATRPRSTTFPRPGNIAIDDVPAGQSEGGYLIIDAPWPSMLGTNFAGDNRDVATHCCRCAGRGYHLAGDGARHDGDGALRPPGRPDDAMNVSGQRIRTIEVESALVWHPAVVEAAVVEAAVVEAAVVGAAVVGTADEMTGQAILAFVILRRRAVDSGDILIGGRVTTSPRRSGPSPNRCRSTSCLSGRTPSRAPSCAARCAASPRTAPSGTRGPCRIRPSSASSARRCLSPPRPPSPMAADSQ